MDLVVVFLTDVGKHIIVPEEYVYGLDLKQLKNRGKNMSRDHLVYWSDDCIEGERYPEPNETAPKSKTFPAPAGGAWYFGRTIHFTGMCHVSNRIVKQQQKKLCFFSR